MRSAIEVLIGLYGWDVFEDAGVLHFVSRGLAEPAPLEDAQIASVEVDRALVEYSSEQESEVPATLHLNALNGLEDYQEVQRSARRIDSVSLRQQTISAPLVLDSGEAERHLSRRLHDGWTGRRTATFALPRRYQNLTVGDLVTFASEDSGRIYRISQIEEGNVLEVTARATELPRTNLASESGLTKRPPNRVPASKPLVHFLDLPVLPVDGGDSGNWFVATSRPWSGTLSAFASPTERDFDYRGAIEQQATVGEIVEGAPPGGAISRWDNAAEPVIKLFTGTLTSAEAPQVLAGGNAVAVRHDQGWEIIQYERAELVADRIWKVSKLLRGQAGTEHLAILPLQSGSAIVVLDGALTRLPITDNELGLSLNWRIGSGENSLAETSFSQASYTSGYRSRLPLSPVHLKATGSVGEGFTASWIRRDRNDLGDWNAMETVMSEADERYTAILTFASGVEIAKETNLPKAAFTAFEILSAAPAGDTVSSLTVVQMNASYGAGDQAILAFD